MLAPGGILLSTWFVFDKRDFPMMQEDQNTLFINEYDVRNAVIYDRAWIRQAAADVGLVLRDVIAPPIRGHQWQLRMTQPGPGIKESEWPEDLAERGRQPPPMMPANASLIGRRPTTIRALRSAAVARRTAARTPLVRASAALAASRAQGRRSGHAPIRSISKPAETHQSSSALTVGANQLDGSCASSSRR